MQDSGGIFPVRVRWRALASGARLTAAKPPSRATGGFLGLIVSPSSIFNRAVTTTLRLSGRAFGTTLTGIPDRESGMPEKARLDGTPDAAHARPFDAGEPPVVRLSLSAGERVDPHTHPDRKVVLVLRSGVLDVDIGEKTHRVEAGDVLRFDGRNEVSPYAVEDSDALIVLAHRPEKAQ